MKTPALFLLLSLPPATALPPPATIRPAAAVQPLPTVQPFPAGVGQYIVTIRPGAGRRVRAMASVPRTVVTHVFGHVLNGFSARLGPAERDRLRRDPDVTGIAAVVPVHATYAPARTTQANPTWGLDRIDATSGLDQRYTYTRTGKGVTAYVIDTGIDVSAADFGGRASVAYDAIKGDGRDCNGHGTHVAGTIGGTTYGVAKDVTLAGVRVLDCLGSGTDADVIAGMDWVAAHVHRPAVANMSLGAARSAAMDAAASKLAEDGIFVAVAAGNAGGDACAASPSGARGVLAVAASDQTDASAWFTNRGRCVTMYAPGVGITSDWLNGATKAVSGTSMATPHVTGVAALYKEAVGDGSQATVTAWLTAHAVTGAITGLPAGSPNLLLNKGTL